MDYLYATMVQFVDLVGSRDRIIQLVWLISHQALLSSTLVLTYDLIVKGTWNANLYIESVLTCVLTYSIVTVRHFLFILSSDKPQIDVRPEQNSHIPLAPIIKSENTYLLAISIINYNSIPSVFKLLPFCVYSFLNLYMTLLDDFFPDSLFSKTLLPYIGIVEDQSLSLASSIEAVVIFKYFGDLVLHHDKSLLAYLFIMLLRLDCSNHVRQTVHQFCALVYRISALALKEPYLTDMKQVLTRMEFLTSPEMYPGNAPPASTKKRVASLNFETVQIIDDI